MSSTSHRIKDIGPKPQSFDIERATKENTYYRSVAWSGRYLQVTLMSIPVGGDIGLEARPRNFFSVNFTKRLASEAAELPFQVDVHLA